MSTHVWTSSVFVFIIVWVWHFYPLALAFFYSNEDKQTDFQMYFRSSLLLIVLTWHFFLSTLVFFYSTANKLTLFQNRFRPPVDSTLPSSVHQSFRWGWLHRRITQWVYHETMFWCGGGGGGGGDGGGYHFSLTCLTVHQCLCLCSTSWTLCRLLVGLVYSVHCTVLVVIVLCRGYVRGRG